MIAGHALLAFALAVALAQRRGVGQMTLVAFGTLAAAFAVLPDIDILFATDAAFRVLFAQASVDAAGNGPFTGTVHRGLTHSFPMATLVILFSMALTKALTSERRGPPLLVVALCFGGLTLLCAILIDGLLGSLVASAYVLGAGGLVVGVVRTSATYREVGLAGLVGLWSHPFGDLFTGQPPALLYPFSTEPMLSRVILVEFDPTLNLLAVFLLELGCAWAFLRAWMTAHQQPFAMNLSPLGLVGIGYSGVVLFVVPPTMDAPYQFVYALLGLGVWAMVPALLSRATLRAVTTGVTTVTLGVLSYAFVYVCMYTRTPPV